LVTSSARSPGQSLLKMIALTSFYSAAARSSVV
jgi:hypothetical protein